MKIYISATYRDLQKHRLEVSKILRRMGHQTLGMEDYIAEGVRPLSRCLDDVKECDVYVGIVAWRYGYVPTTAAAGADLQKPAGTMLDKTSITEFEYRQAIQSKTQSGKPEVLMFLLDPEAEWPASQFDAVSGDSEDRERTERGKEISRFRQEVGKEYLASFFRTPEELASLVSAAVYRAEISRQMSLKQVPIETMLNTPFMSGGPAEDTSLEMITKVLAGPREIQALKINIGHGRSWWMTRLYFLSSIAADPMSIEAMVFVDEEDTFIGVTNPRSVKERLAQAYPTIKQYEDMLARSGEAPLPDLPNEMKRRLNIWTNQMNAQGGGAQQSYFRHKTRAGELAKPLPDHPGNRLEAGR